MVEGQPMPGEQNDQANPLHAEPTRAGDALEERVRRLEAAISRLTPDPAPPDLLRIQAEPNYSPAPPESPPRPRPIPRATPIPPVPTASLAEFTLPPVALPPTIPDASFRPLQHGLPMASQVLHRVLPPSSILRDLWWDLRTGYRMLRDPSYPMTATAKVVPLLAVFYVCVWPWFSSWTGLIGTMLSGLVNILVLYVSYKVIQRELRRYYDFSQRYRR